MPVRLPLNVTCWFASQLLGLAFQSKERKGSFFDHAAQKPFATTYMQHFALYAFAEQRQMRDLTVTAAVEIDDDDEVTGER